MGDLTSFLLTLKDAITCENDFGQGVSLNCTPGSFINIGNANYGRTDTFTCYMDQTQITNCFSNKTQLLANFCNGKQSCVYTPLSFSYDPCPGTNKYLKVQYTCIIGKLFFLKRTRSRVVYFLERIANFFSIFIRVTNPK